MGLMTADLCALIVLSLMIIHLTPSVPFAPPPSWPPYLYYLSGFSYAFVAVTAMLAMGCYASDTIRSFKTYFIRLPIVLLALLLLFVGGAVLFTPLVSLLTLVSGLTLLGLIILPVIRYSVLKFDARLSLRMRVVVLGDDDRITDLCRQVASARECGVEIVRVIHMSADGAGQRGIEGQGQEQEYEQGPPRHDMFGTIDDLSAYVKSAKADSLIVLGAAREMPAVKEALIACKLDGVHIQDLTSFYEQAFGYVEIDSLRDEWIIFSDGFKGSSWLEYGLKRLSDIVVSLLVLVLASPIILLAALLVRLTSRGPIFYTQERVGYKGKVFTLYKFRTMAVTAEKSGPQWAQENDPRVTAIGGFLRRTRIDELPQIFNVLNGDMSFVGPRPERPFFVDQFNSKIPFYQDRHHVKPGITGWAQLRYPYGASEEDAKRKLEYDLYYLKNYSLFLDILIIVQTVRVILFPSGVR